MDIDLIAGLIKPKIALAELPALETQELQEGATPDFSALLNGTVPDEATAPELKLAPDGPAKPVAELPPALVPKIAAEPKSESMAKEDADVKPAPDTTALPMAKNAPPSPDLPLVPLPIKAEQAVSSQIRPTIEASAIHRIAAPTTTEQTAKVAEYTPALWARSEAPMRLGSHQKREFTADMPVAAAPKPQSEPKAPMAAFSPLAFDKHADPKVVARQEPPPVDIPALPAKLPPKGGVQVPSLPTPILGFSNVETVVPAPDEIQFGIKIERQAVEVTSISRSAPQAAPVASQITAQLPQMLTKAGNQTVELRLDPPELGRVTIHLTTNDQHVTAQVVAERVDTVDLMRRHAELLTATLARAGFSEANLSFQQGQGQNSKSEFEQFQGLTELVERDEPTTSAPTLSGQDGRLDIRL